MRQSLRASHQVTHALFPLVSTSLVHLLFHLCYFLKHALPTFGYSTVSAPPTFYQIIVSSRTIVQTPVAIIPRDSSCDAGRHYHHQCSSRWVHFLRCTHHLEAMVLSYLFGSNSRNRHPPCITWHGLERLPSLMQHLLITGIVNDDNDYHGRSRHTCNAHGRISRHVDFPPRISAFHLITNLHYVSSCSRRSTFISKGLFWLR